MKSGSIRDLPLPLLLPVLAILSIALSAITPSDGQSNASQDTRFDALAKVPENVRIRSNPLESDSHAVAAGRKLYEQHCAECHGAAGEGGKKAPSLRADPIHNAKPGALFWILTNGVVRRGMPVWSKLPEPQRWQIVSYIRSFPPPESGNAQ